jgi:hypothetical protein
VGILLDSKAVVKLFGGKRRAAQGSYITFIAWNGSVQAQLNVGAE